MLGAAPSATGAGLGRLGARVRALDDSINFSTLACPYFLFLPCMSNHVQIRSRAGNLIDKRSEFPKAVCWTCLTSTMEAYWHTSLPTSTAHWDTPPLAVGAILGGRCRHCHPEQPCPQGALGPGHSPALMGTKVLAKKCRGPADALDCARKCLDP